nr:DUF401 family protein [Desulfobacterales bacterium]
MEFLTNIPALIKVSATFAIITFLMRLKISLGSALLAGSILLGFWCALSPVQIATSMVRSILDEKSIVLSLIVSLILVLSHSLEKTGHMQRLLDSFKGVSQNVRLNLAVFPALIGLLPMPGGAIFSAPMVDALSKQESITPEQKTLINYWFRHVWEFSWPLYPGFILTCALSGISVGNFFLAQFPLTLFMLLVGYLGIIRPIPMLKESDRTYHRGSLTDFLVELFPILLVICGSLIGGAVLHLLRGLWNGLEHLPKEFPLLLVLILSILWVWWKNGIDNIREITQILINRSLVAMIFMILAIMIFQGILKDSNSISEISQSLIAGHVPIFLIVLVLPFIVGGVVGITIAFVGTTFPIIFSLLSSFGLHNEIFPYTILGFCAGYVGVLLSPLHVCLILTNAYFSTDLNRIYRFLWFPCTALMTAGIVSFFLSRLLFTIS